MRTGVKRRVLSIFLSVLMFGSMFSFSFAASNSNSSIGNVPSIAGHAAYRSITLRWPKVAGAEYYQLLRYDSASNKSIEYRVTNRDTDPNNKAWITCRDGGANNTGAYYSYYVYAVKTVNGKKVRSAVPAKAKYIRLVRQMYQTIWLKSSVTLSSHAGGSGSRTFGPNQALVATGFGGGKYKFWYGGRLYYCHVTRVRKATSDYSRNWNYSNITAENFVNELTSRKVISKSNKSNYLIWVSTYTQHIYVYKWLPKTKKWTLFKMKMYDGKEYWSNWECSTGKAESPTRIDMNMSIYKKRSWDGGIQWWSYFSTDNAIHGKRPRYVVDGAPHSSGCVRNYNNDAKWIYENCPIGTPVVIY